MNMHQHDHMAMSQNDETNAAQFCKPMMSGGGMTMYMNGFSFSLSNTSSKSKQPKPCLTFFLEGVTLDTRFKFFFAMISIIGLGIIVEGIAYSKRQYIAGVKKKRLNGNEHEFMKAKAIFTVFQCLQALTGYILMLSAMTYSIELLLSAVVGLACGSFVFGKHKVLLSKSEDDVIVEDRESPCCNDLVEDDGLTYGTMSNTEEYVSVKGSEDDYDDEYVESTSGLLGTRRRSMEVQQG